MKLPRFSLKIFVAWAVLCVAGGLAFVWLANMSFWLGASIAAVALFFNGLVAEVEDNAPGGFNNPEGKTK
jgi:hypothetical protein